jgi:hypothetical protein
MRRLDSESRDAIAGDGDSASAALYPQVGTQMENSHSAHSGLSPLSAISSGKRRKYFYALQSLLREKVQPLHPYNGVHCFAAYPCRLAAASMPSTFPPETANNSDLRLDRKRKSLRIQLNAEVLVH